MPPRTQNPTLTTSESGSGKRKNKARTEDIPTEGGRRRLEPDGRKKRKARTEKEPTPPPVEEHNPSPPVVQETDSDYPPPPQITEDNEEDTEPLQPELFFPHTEYCKTIKIASKCKVKSTLKALEILGRDEKLWFSNHSQFKHIWHMPSQKNHQLMAMWLTLLRTMRMEKDVKMCWFVVNDVPIRYSLREHGLISGLATEAAAPDMGQEEEEQEEEEEEE